LKKRPKNPLRLAALLKICFQNRRKQIGSIFRRANLPFSLLDGLDPQLRPENLGVEDFAQIAEKGRDLLAAKAQHQA
jgi:16S rRNA (adenine1518-N6/adenine1519-N6)-dimethyltransferase